MASLPGPSVGGSPVGASFAIGRNEVGIAEAYRACRGGPGGSATMPAGGARSCVVLGATGWDAPHLPVPAAVASRPLAPILRMRQEPNSAMKRSPARLKAMLVGLSSQASRAGVPSGAGFGVAPARLIRVDCAVTSRTTPIAGGDGGSQSVGEGDVAVRVRGEAGGGNGGLQRRAIRRGRRDRSAGDGVDDAAGVDAADPRVRWGNGRVDRSGRSRDCPRRRRSWRRCGRWRCRERVCLHRPPCRRWRGWAVAGEAGEGAVGGDAADVRGEADVGRETNSEK